MAQNLYRRAPLPVRGGEFSGGSLAAAFSLIEVLVVIAVLALLLSVLAPALNRVREHGRTIVCGSNVRSLTASLKVYDQENGSFPYGVMPGVMRYYPPPGGWVGNGSIDWAGWWWFHFLDVEYSEDGTPAVLRCPSRNVSSWGLSILENPLCGNYGINQAIARNGRGNRELGFVGKPLRSDQVRSPSQALLLVDSGYTQVSWRAAVEPEGPLFDNLLREAAFYLPGLDVNAGRSFPTACEEDAVYGRHPNRKVNVGYVDGHVQATDVQTLRVTRTESGDYVNRSPLWLPSRSREN